MRSLTSLLACIRIQAHFIGNIDLQGPHKFDPTCCLGHLLR